MMIERHRYYFDGHVQGVGFRFTTERLAQGFDLSGHVRNLEDGRVELVAEGELSEIEQFVAAIRDRFEGNIRDIQRDDLSPVGQSTTGFQIRY